MHYTTSPLKEDAGGSDSTWMMEEDNEYMFMVAVG